MNHIHRLVLVLATAMTLGCSTTTGPSRALAADVGESLDSYIKERQAAVEALDTEYRAVYAALIKEHQELTKGTLDLERKAQARAAADQILLGWSKKTTFTALVSELEHTRDRQYTAMLKRAEATAAARREYADSYTKLQLDLKKLQAARKKLGDLAQEEDVRKNTLELLGLIAKAAYGAGSTEEKK